MSPEEIARLRVLCEAVTPGPCATCCSVCSPSTCADCGMCVCYQLAGNKELAGTIVWLRGQVAAVRTALPTLLAEVERLTKVAAAERALRLAINDMVRALSDGGRLNVATARASEAAAALRALGIEP